MNKMGAALVATLAVVACSGGQDGAPTGEATATGSAQALFAEHEHHAHQRVARTDIVADEPDGAATVDPNLVNAWGLAFSPTGIAWISDNETGKSSVYGLDGSLKLTVTVPPPAGGDTSAPTGQVFNGDPNAFAGDRFVFATEDGTISGWQPGAGATLRFDASASGAVYKGITIATRHGHPRLYAANFHAGTVDVLDAKYQPVHHARFIDWTIPRGFAPFNVLGIGEHVLVAYAKQDADAHDDVAGPGNGFLDLFDADGRLEARLVAHGPLDSPWGMAWVSSFGRVHDRLLVGNFGDGTIHVFEIASRTWGLVAEHEGALLAPDGSPLVIDGLWAIALAPSAACTDALFFTAGPEHESHGRFGRLDPL